MALTEGATAGDGDARKVAGAGGTDVGDIGSRFIEGTDEGVLAGASSLGVPSPEAAFLETWAAQAGQTWAVPG